MASPFDQSTQAVAAYVKNNPGLFAGVLPQNVIAHLGIVNKPLFDQLNNAYVASNPDSSTGFTGFAPTDAARLARKGGETLTEWSSRNGGYGQGLLDSNYNQGAYLPPPEAPAPAPVAPTVNTQDKFDADAQKRVDEYNKQISANYDQAGQGLVSSIQHATAPGRSKVIAEEAALGRIGSPVSIPTLSKYDEQTQNAIGSGLTQLKANQASGGVDLAKTIEGILQSERDARTQSQQFGQTLSERGRQFDLSHQLEAILGQSAANLAERKRQDAIPNDTDTLLGRIKTGTDIAKNIFGGGDKSSLLF